MIYYSLFMIAWHVQPLFIGGSRIFNVLPVLYFTEKYSIIAVRNNPSANIIHASDKNLRCLRLALRHV